MGPPDYFLDTGVFVCYAHGEKSLETDIEACEQVFADDIDLFSSVTAKEELDKLISRREPAYEALLGNLKDGEELDLDSFDHLSDNDKSHLRNLVNHINQARGRNRLKYLRIWMGRWETRMERGKEKVDEWVEKNKEAQIYDLLKTRCDCDHLDAQIILDAQGWGNGPDQSIFLTTDKRTILVKKEDIQALLLDYLSAFDSKFDDPSDMDDYKSFEFHYVGDYPLH